MHPRIRTIIAAAAAFPLAVGLVAAEGDDTTLVEQTETVFVSAGCPADETGTCTSTRWLGRSTGDATSNFTTAIVPADEVIYRATGDINWRDYPSKAKEGFDDYLLDPSRDMTMTISVAGDGVGANITVHGKVDLRHCQAVTTEETDPVTGEVTEVTTLEDCTTLTINHEPQTILVGAAASVTGETSADFTFDLPDELEGRTLDSMTAWTAVHGMNGYYGFINQEGGSPVTIPHLVEVEAEA